MTVTVAETGNRPVEAEPQPDVSPHDDDVLAELLVEEISIDGMCGVY
jgi:mycofactocin precursor